MLEQKLVIDTVQAGLAITENDGVILSWSQFCSVGPEFFTVFLCSYNAGNCLRNKYENDF